MNADIAPRTDGAPEEHVPGPAAEAAQAEREGYLLTHALSQRLDLVRHLIDFSRQIILIVGDEGSGKTSLLHHLLATVPGNWRVAKVNADPMCNADALLKRLSSELGLHFTGSDDVEGRIAGFKNYLHTTRRALLVPVVMIDDAHLLPADALLLLLRLAEPETEAPHLRVALFCDPRVTRLLGSPQLAAFKDSITHTVEMPAFTLEDTANYLARHWPSPDNESSPILDEQYIRGVHAAGCGNPGRINALVRSSLEAPAAVEEANVQRSTLRLQWRFALSGAAAALSLAAVLWFLQGDRTAGPASTTAAPHPEVIDVTPAPTITPPTVASTPPTVAETDAVDTLPAQQPAASTGTPVAPIDTRGTTAVTPATAARTETPALVPVPPAAPIGEVSQPTGATAPPAMTAAKPPETAADQVPVAKKPKTPVSEKSDTPKSKPQATTKPAPVAKPTPTTAAKGNSWLQRQPKGNFVVQLYGTYHRASAEQFIASHRFGSSAVVVPTVREQKTWYVVVYGSYADRAKARTAMGKLPEAVRRLDPWVRQVRDLQAIAAAKP